MCYQIFNKICDLPSVEGLPCLCTCTGGVDSSIVIFTVFKISSVIVLPLFRCWSWKGSFPWWLCCEAPLSKSTRRHRLLSVVSPSKTTATNRRSIAAAASQRPRLCSETPTPPRSRNSWQVPNCSAVPYVSLRPVVGCQKRRATPYLKLFFFLWIFTMRCVGLSGTSEGVIHVLICLPGLLWNLSSLDTLKPDLLKIALPVLMERVILPYTNGCDQTETEAEAFFHATGCVR